MKHYSIHQTSNMLKISKDTLRYYDKIGLVSPSRKENRYRYYTDQNILDLQYVEVMKKTDFTLSEIQQFFNYQCSLTSKKDCEGIEQLLTNKKFQYQQKIQTYQTMLTLIDKMIHTKKQISSPNQMNKANELITNTFQKIKEQSIT